MRFVSSAIVIAAAAGLAQADVFIDTFDSWTGSRSNGWDKVSQSFEAPIEASYLDTFTVGIGSDDGDDRQFEFFIYGWDSGLNHAVGDALFSTGLLAVPDSYAEFMTIDVGLQLTGGQEYAAIVDFVQGAGNGVTYIGGDVYEDGYQNFTSGDVSEEWAFDQGQYDSAFGAAFTPAPGTLALLGAGGVLATRRRR